MNEDSSASVFQHAAELRRRGLFGQVREGFWKQEPSVADLVRSLPHRRIFIAPLLISEGYFSEVVIPRALGFEPTAGADWPRVREMDGRQVLYARPVGTHEHMTQVLLARAEEVVRKHPFPRAPGKAEISLFIAGHGTEQNENSREAIERQVEAIRNLGQYGSVGPVFLEERPKIPECFELAATRNLVIVPFFMSDGMHVQEDIPVLLGEPKVRVEERLRAGRATWRNPTERRGKLLWYTRSVGTDPLVAEVILDRVREVAGLAHVGAGRKIVS